MKILKQVFKAFVLLPNLPFIFIFGLYILYDTYKENGFIVLENLNNHDKKIFDIEMKRKINKLYPNKYIIALCFYVWFVFVLFN